MTRQDLSTLNYILGRMEGLACGCQGDVRDGLLDTCEQLSEIILRYEKAEGQHGG